MDKIKAIEKAYFKKEIPKFEIGDTVKVYLKIVEGENTRSQVFEGIVMSRKGSGLKQTLTVRRVSYGVGIEKTLQLHSPNIEKIKVVKSEKVRRSKLYYLRKK